ncbi:MAG TPA: helix-turn-helix domain-containing protein [Acidimicrobiales bacterium]|nr:helix-turn-helix domain-containing protein [Acidimicrobiales bacterium]
MVVDRRAELIDAGIRLLGRQQFQALLAAVETRSIADEAGVTTGSFFHHFRNRSHFALAVADAFVSRWAERVDRLEGAATASNDREGYDGIRPAAAEEWAGLVAEEDLSALQHLLWSVRRQELGAETARTAGDVLHDAYRGLTDSVEATYLEGVRRIGREMLPPFTSCDLTVIMTALAEGLQMRHGADPESVREGLYADAVSAVLLGITRPRVERSEADPAPELSTLESRLLVHHRRPAESSDEPVETWRHIADAAAHLFVDRSPGEVRVSEVAAAAGVSTTTVYHHFGTVNAVAAAAWARHMPELESIASAPITAEEGPIRRIEQVLLRYVQMARANRGATEALAAQIVAEAAPSGERQWPRDTRAVVPLPGVLLPLIRELRAVGRLRRRMETVRLARSLVHLTTMQALLFGDEPDERIVDETMSLIFDGALVAPSDG